MSLVERRFEECITCGDAAENGICLGCGLEEELCECPPREEQEPPGE